MLLEPSEGNSFTSNTAVTKGGALFLFKSCIQFESVDSPNSIEADFSNEQAWQHGKPTVSVTSLSYNRARYGGAMYLEDSTASLNGLIDITFFNNTADTGGAIYSVDSIINVTAHHTLFSWNSAENDKGGAYFGFKGSLHLDTAVQFDHNSANVSGGAVHYRSGHLSLMGKELFINNYCARYGGAIAIESNTSAHFGGTAMNFINNSVTFTIKGKYSNGGGVYVDDSTLAIATNSIRFVNNSALTTGGGLYVKTSKLQVEEAVQMEFIGNFAWEGGGLGCSNSLCNISATAARYVSNYARRGGGGILVGLGSVFHHNNIYASNNSEIAIVLAGSNITFSGKVNINCNIGKTDSTAFLGTGGGGGILALASIVSFTGNVTLEDNSATTNGGAIMLTMKSTLLLSGVVLFRNNTANGNGGAIFATDSTIIASSTITFTSNKAQNGGAMHFQNGAKISLHRNSSLATFSNFAVERGGAIYHSDAIAPSQCNSTMEVAPTESALPGCFIDVTFYSNNIYLLLLSFNNSAGISGGFLYGGLLDKCLIVSFDYSIPGVTVIGTSLFYSAILANPNISSIQDQTISSEPYLLCSCESVQDYNCSSGSVEGITTDRGRKFTVSLLTLAQANTLSSAQLRAKLSPTARLSADQILQTLQNCTEISYNLYSSKQQEELALYLNNGPCQDLGAASKRVTVTFLPCPHALALSGDECVCEERLKELRAVCTIGDNGTFITRTAESTFWMSPLYSDATYQGLILYPICPLGYCKTRSINISLNHTDVQCEWNRSGVLCGACAANYSLVLGSSECHRCSNTYLAMLIPFAAAGIVLVVFLSALRLTVATGLINSVILYANIVQANKNMLFPTSSVLTVFIAWMNLDLGIHTCFYDGLDAYAKAWLQFVFPVYVWFLISLIILASRYSVTVTRLIGSNPTAVLATLILMSYTKMLRIIIDVYSSAKLDYPGNVTMTVWLKDANVPYLETWHLGLTMVTTLVLVFLFLPYTLLLLLGYCLYRCTGRIYSRWFFRVKQFLDCTYYAPYKSYGRFWPGFLLLVRCALYIVFSYDSYRYTSRSLLAVIITFAVLIVCLSARIYSSFYINAMEAVVYLNLIVLSAAASTGVNSPTVVNSLVGIVFALTIGIILYHFHAHYIAKFEAWQKIQSKFYRDDENISESTPLLSPVDNTRSAPKPAVVTHSVISVQE